MCSLYSSEPSEAAGSMRGDGSPFTQLWAKVNFPTTSVPANNLSTDSCFGLVFRQLRHSPFQGWAPLAIFGLDFWLWIFGWERSIVWYSAPGRDQLSCKLEQTASRWCRWRACHASNAKYAVRSLIAPLFEKSDFHCPKFPRPKFCKQF